MTIHDIVLKSLGKYLEYADVEAFCRQEQITPEAFCDVFARHVATEFVNHRFTFDDADSAIADLSGHYFVADLGGLPAFAFSIFWAIDVGGMPPAQARFDAG